MRTINGKLLKEMLISASNNLYNHYPEIDALNVFPVPDGDTGMNMNLTMSSGLKEIQNRNDDNVYDIATSFSKGLLMGARGNSGVITSQIFRGFAQSLEGKNEIKAMDLAEALVNGKEVAYKAVMRPVEGTILTVIRESSESLLKKIKGDISIEKAMKILIDEAKISLNHTPELLPILKEVGVVDSGGAGLLTIFEGMNQAVLGNVVEKSQATATEEKGSSIISSEESGEGYRITFALKLGPERDKKIFVEKRFISVLESHGTNVEESLDNEVLTVSLNSYTPGTIISYAQNFGEFISLTVVNTLNITPSPEEEKDSPKKEYGLIAVSAGRGLDQMFSELGADQIVSGGQTMNPSTEDFIAAIKKVNAKNIFILPNNSNIIMAATQACDVIDDDINAQVIPSKSVPQGIVSAMMFNTEISPEENYNEMKDALSSVKSGSITYAIKDTDIDGMHVTKDYYMGIYDKNIVVCEKDKFTSLYKLIAAMVDEDSAIITLIVGEDVKEDEGEMIGEMLRKKYPDLDVDVRRGDQPVYSFIVGVE
jgi:DAK2 domain fusion protein YloV